MERKELRAYLGVTVWNGDKDHDADVYVKSLADSVMDEYEENIKELNKQLENAENAYYSLKMDMENRIKELEATISKMETHGWVSVKDRMPTENDILFDTNFPFVCLIRYCGSYQVHQCDLGVFLDKKYGDVPIIAWMPLPPPPKEESK